jgi:hypothetical protein
MHFSRNHFYTSRMSESLDLGRLTFKTAGFSGSSQPAVFFVARLIDPESSQQWNLPRISGLSD